MTVILTGKSGTEYEFTRHSLGKPLLEEPGIFVFFGVTAEQAEQAKILFGGENNAAPTADQPDQPIYVAETGNLNLDIGDLCNRSEHFSKNVGGGAAYFNDGRSRPELSVVLHDLLAAYSQPQSI